MNMRAQPVEKEQNTDVSTFVLRIIGDLTMMRPDQIDLASSPDEIGLDSQAIIELIFAVEEEFDVRVPFNANSAGDDLFDVSSIGAIILSVAGLITRKSA